MITLHGVSASPFVRKVMAVLAIKDLAYDHIPQMPFQNDKEYEKINPLGKVPTLQDQGKTICDSKVICRYLEAAYPEVPVYPADAGDRAMADWYEELGGTRIAELAAGIFFQRFMRPMAFKQDPDEELVAKIINEHLPPMLDYVESQVPADGFLYGSLGVADIALASPFVNAGYAGYSVDAERWPLFAGFVGRVLGHDIMAPLLDAEAEQMGFKREA